jgi:hypothetical protein
MSPAAGAGGAPSVKTARPETSGDCHDGRLAEPVPPATIRAGEEAAVRQARAMLVGAVAAVAVGGGVVLLWPAPASGLENGRFEADCCGTLELRDGEMLLNGRETLRYDVGRDSRGPYLLPRTYYVGGLEDRGFEVDGTRPALKLRLDRLPGPQTLLLPADGPDFLMKRAPSRSPAAKRALGAR